MAGWPIGMGTGMFFKVVLYPECLWALLALERQAGVHRSTWFTMPGTSVATQVPIILERHGALTTLERFVGIWCAGRLQEAITAVP